MENTDAFLTPEADEDLGRMDSALRRFFIKHIEKLKEKPPSRHLKFGLPYHVEEVTHQARMIYDLKDNNIAIHRCFATHKEYEKWYQSFR